MMTMLGAPKWVQSIASDEVLRIPMGYSYLSPGVHYNGRGAAYKRTL